MNKPKNALPIFDNIRASLEEAIAYERGNPVNGVRVQTLTADDSAVEAVSQRLINQNQKAFEQLAGQIAHDDERVNLNTAPWEEMAEKLGYRAAAGVYEYRKLFGGFKSVEEFQRARGVGKVTYAKLKDKVCV